MVKVLFVCTGNICRSPSAEGVFRHMVRQAGLDAVIATDSAGTHSFHVGEPPDPRSQEAALRRGIDLGDLRARKVRPQDFQDFDLLLAMDSGHYNQLLALCPPGREDRVRMFLSFAPDLRVTDVPDPYYGEENGFDYVLDLIEAASAGLLAHLRDQLPASALAAE